MGSMAFYVSANLHDERHFFSVLLGETIATGWLEELEVDHSE